MKKIALLILTLALVAVMFAGCGSNKKVLAMATEATFPPYEYLVGNDVVGVDVDVAKLIAEELGMELRVDNMSFDAVIPSVQSGSSDFGAAGMSITEERMEQVAFSIPYAESTQVILTTADSGINGPDDLNGKLVGVQLGTTADIVLSEENPEVELHKLKKYSDLALELANGTIDAIVLDSLPAAKMQKTNDTFVVLEAVLFSDTYAICVSKDNPELLEKINTVLTKLIAEGKIDEFTETHLGK